VLAVPIGLTFGVLFGLRGRTLSAQSTRAVFACAIVCSCLCLAALAWVVPLANQEFRQIVFGSSDGSPNVVESLNELTLGELSERLSSFRRSGFTDWDARMLAYTYHMRWAVSCATLVLVLFAMAMRHRLLARWAVAVAAVAVCFSYYVLMWVGRAGALQEALPAFAGAWLPNAAFALAWLGLTALAAPRQRARPEGRI
jgi:lipopolysaccharide export LptBFGC system permease protein LptF